MKHVGPVFGPGMQKATTDALTLHAALLKADIASSPSPQKAIADAFKVYEQRRGTRAFKEFEVNCANGVGQVHIMKGEEVMGEFIHFIVQDRSLTSLAFSSFFTLRQTPPKPNSQPENAPPSPHTGHKVRTLLNGLTPTLAHYDDAQGTNTLFGVIIGPRPPASLFHPQMLGKSLWGAFALPLLARR